jgi:acyl-CoA thioesterase
MGEFEFDAATRLVPLSSQALSSQALSSQARAEGGFSVDIDNQWSGLASVNGGFLLSLCVKALDVVLPFPDPIAVSGFYLRPGNPGLSQVRTEVIRSGRTTAFGQASLEQGGKEVLRVTAAFSDLTSVSVEFLGRVPPKLPDPEGCRQLQSISGITMGHRFEYRAPVMPGWLKGTPSGDPTAEFWMRFADGRDADPLTLPLIVDAAPPVVLELGASSTTIELNVHLRARPAPGWLACRVITRYVSGGYHEEDVEVWDSAGTLVAQSRQLALIRR